MFWISINNNTDFDNNGEFYLIEGNSNEEIKNKLLKESDRENYEMVDIVGF